MILGLLSDAHGCVECFDLACSILEEQGADRLVFLGDAVGYLPGMAVVERLLERNVEAILGNHDGMLLDGGPDPDKDAVYRLRETRAEATAAQLHAMSAWPRSRRQSGGAGTLLMVHGSPQDPLWGYVYPDTDLATLDAEGAVAVAMGNTHRAFVRRHGQSTFVNCGSCALPRDGGMLGAACLYDTESGDARLLRFPVAESFRAALHRVGPVHQSVLALAERPAPRDIAGELVGRPGRGAS